MVPVDTLDIIRHTPQFSFPQDRMVFTRPPVAALVLLFQEQSTKRRNGCNRIVTETAMSNLHLPAEILDHIVHHLRDAEDALRSCCLASKS